jgi:hypothetical protein
MVLEPNDYQLDSFEKLGLSKWQYLGKIAKNWILNWLWLPIKMV